MFFVEITVDPKSQNVSAGSILATVHANWDFCQHCSNESERAACPDSEAVACSCPGRIQLSKQRIRRTSLDPSELRESRQSSEILSANYDPALNINTSLFSQSGELDVKLREAKLCHQPADVSQCVDVSPC